MAVTASKSGPGFAGLLLSLKELKKSEVYVGIPADKTLRKGDEMNNASILFILSKGSELANIPPRPVLEPSVEANQKLITPHLAKAAQAVMEKDSEKASMELARAGTIAANGAKRWFTDPRNNWPPNAESTIAAKGSDRPMIDTGQMRRAITYVVTQSGRETVAPPPPAEETAAPKPGIVELPVAAAESGVAAAAEDVVSVGLVYL